MTKEAQLSQKYRLEKTGGRECFYFPESRLHFVYLSRHCVMCFIHSVVARATT